jgi:hypothetical protein
MLLRVPASLAAIAVLMVTGSSAEFPVSAQLPADTLADTLRGRIDRSLPVCPMPVFRPPTSVTLAHPTKPDSPLLDSLRLVLPYREATEQMPIVRSGCTNPLDQAALPMPSPPRRRQR